MKEFDIKIKETLEKTVTVEAESREEAEEMVRQSYLKEHNPMLLNDLILGEKLFPHLWEIDETAHRRVEQLMTELLEQNPAPDKATQQMAWVQHMNSLKAQAEEIVVSELVNS